MTRRVSSMQVSARQHAERLGPLHRARHQPRPDRRRHWQKRSQPERFGERYSDAGPCLPWTSPRPHRLHT
jgi:hypothetical protein